MKPNEFDDALIIEKAYGTPFGEFVRSIYQQESGGGKNTKTSNAGARGGMQIIPSTFNSVADKGWDINDEFDNARAGIRYARKMWEQAGGDPVLAAAGYYGGPGGLEKARKGIAVSDPRNPKAPNTLQYGQQVAARLGVTPSKAPSSDATPSATPTVVAAAQEPTQVIFPAQAVVDSTGYSAIKANIPHGNAWQSFVAALSKRDQSAAPIEPADLSFSGNKSLAALSLPPSVIAGAPARKPNFEAFRGWGTQA